MKEAAEDGCERRERFLSGVVGGLEESYGTVKAIFGLRLGIMDSRCCNCTNCWGAGVEKHLPNVRRELLKSRYEIER